jgi:peptidoglycan/LPS O-acetylase OafA/YrhL
MGNISFAFYMFQLTAFYVFKPFQSYIEKLNLSEYISSPVELLMLVLINLTMASLVFKYFEEPVRLYLLKKMIRK